MASIEIRRVDPLEGLSPDDKSRMEYLAKTSLPQRFQSRVEPSDLDMIRTHSEQSESLSKRGAGQGMTIGLGIAFLWTVRSALRRRRFPPLFDRRATNLKDSLEPFLKRWAEEESKINKGSWIRFGFDIVIGSARFALRALPLVFIGVNVGAYRGGRRAQSLFDQDLDVSGRRSAIFDAQHEALSKTMQEYLDAFGHGLDLPELRIQTVRDEETRLLRSELVAVGPGGERRLAASEGSEKYSPTLAQHDHIQKLLMRWQSLIAPQARLPALVQNIDNPPTEGTVLILDPRRDGEDAPMREKRLEREKRRKEFEALFEQETKGVDDTAGDEVWR